MKERWLSPAPLALSALAGLIAGALLFAALLPGPARSHEQRDFPPEQVGVDERLGMALTTGLSFRDQGGQTVRLSRYFTGVPVILTLNYYACPTLCPLVFRNLVRSMEEMEGLALGRDFRVVTVSIDPEESLARASDKAAKTHAMLRHTPDPGGSWPFLVGSPAAIQSLTRQVGVRYSAVGKNDFAHPNVVIVVTPQGRVSRYLYGLELPARDLKLALIEAAQGRIGSSQLLNRALLYCFRYDPVGREYVLLASRLVTASMGLVMALTTGLLALLWRRERRARKGLKPPPAPPTGSGQGFPE
jgi:protein SCO1/2